MFSGKSGMGKTRLIEACREDVCKSVDFLPFQFRDAAVGISEIFRAVRVGLKIHTQYITLSGFPQKIYGNDTYNVNLSPGIRYSCMFLTKIQVQTSFRNSTRTA